MLSRLLRILGRKRDQICGFVMVNDDGSVRELTNEEREYVEDDHLPGDGPYIKKSYRSLDGWGNISGFILRKRLPKGIQVSATENNDGEGGEYDLEDVISAHKSIGDIVSRNPDGTISVTCNSNLDPEERLALFKKTLDEIGSTSRSSGSSTK